MEHALSSGSESRISPTPRQQPESDRRPGIRAHRCIMLVFLTAIGSAAAQLPPHYERHTAKPVSEVLEDAEFAVTERNFRVTGRLSIGRAIRERDGAAFPDFEVLLFCNLSLAREMLELKPEFIAFCPGRITIRDSDGTVVISAPLLPEDSTDVRLNQLAVRLNTLIREIVDYAAQQWSPAVHPSRARAGAS